MKFDITKAVTRDGAKIEWGPHPAGAGWVYGATRDGVLDGFLVGPYGYSRMSDGRVADPCDLIMPAPEVVWHRWFDRDGRLIPIGPTEPHDFHVWMTSDGEIHAEKVKG